MKTLFIFLMVAMGLQTVGTMAVADEDGNREQALNELKEKESHTESEIEKLEQTLGDAAAKLDQAAGNESTPGDGEVDPTLAAYFKHKERMARAENQNVDSDTLAAVFVPTTFFGMTVLLVFLPLYLRNKRRGLEAEVQRKAIDAGLQFIPEMPAPLRVKRNDKRTGLILAALGIAGAVPVALYGFPKEAVFGLAPVFLGGAYFLAGKYLTTDKA